jgi:hypothetical protein
LQGIVEVDETFIGGFGCHHRCGFGIQTKAQEQACEEAKRSEKAEETSQDRK